uniref:Ig-like domain-containing protein n=1 Tax=Echeneis naucrates TaxID=173247 RepID=A0A665TEY7_ECHNA
NYITYFVCISATNISIMGSVVTMECKVAGSLPISVEWSKGKQKINRSWKYKLLQIENTMILEFPLTESADTAEYSCTVSNKSWIVIIFLWILVPPRFLAEPESQAVTPKSTVLFRSVFEGTPPFTIQWFKDDIELITMPSCTIRLEEYSSSVELHSVGTLQSGIYSCHVSNDAGAVKSAADSRSAIEQKHLQNGKFLMTQILTSGSLSYFGTQSENFSMKSDSTHFFVSIKDLISVYQIA